MRWDHFRAFLWLRWRIRMNQLKRGGVANAILLAILAPILVLVGIGLFFGLFAVGWQALPRADPLVPIVMFIFDGMVLLFLFSWGVTLLAELQRSEVLSIDKFLHLPVSIKGVFLINYLSTLASLNLAVFVPALLGLGLGLALGIGPAMLLMVPLVAAFVLMVTAVTYQFQGWLASLMVNPRRRKTVIAVVTMVFVLLCLSPQLITSNLARQHHTPNEQHSRLARDKAALLKEFQQNQINTNEYNRRDTELKAKYDAESKAATQQTWHQVDDTVWYINLVFPPGWLALGARAAAEGSVLPAIVAGLGMTLVGAGSLRRSYHTTLRLYTGHYTARQTKAAIVAPAPVAGEASRGLLERELPWLSEQVSAIALASFRCLVRAPEAKMLLLTPIIMVLVFGSMFFTNKVELPESVRPLVVFGGTSMVLLGLIQLVGNQFGFDRNGFRVFVLCSAPRRDILLGKNLAIAPFAFFLASVLALIVEVVYPLRIDHLLATWPQMISMFFLFCLLANCMSILAPTAIASGSLKPASPKLLTVLLQLLFVSVMPVILVPLILPLGLEFLLVETDLITGVPIYFLMSILLCCLVVPLYFLVISWQGTMLQWREQRILEVVTAKVE